MALPARASLAMNRAAPLSSLPAEPSALSSPAAGAEGSRGTEALYRAALGPGAVTRYLAVFARFDERGAAWPHWNPAAGWLGPFWLWYRRLWRPALGHALLLGLALLAWWWVQRQTGPWAPGVRWGLLALIGGAAVAVPGWWGDAWLHAAVRRRMMAAVQQARTVQEACLRLDRAARWRHVWVPVALVEALIAFGVLVGAAPGSGAPRVATPASVAPPVAGVAPPPPSPVTVPEEAVAPAALTDRLEAMPVAGPVAESPVAVSALASPPPSEPAPLAPPAATAPPAPGVPAVPRRLHGHGVAVGIFSVAANAERAERRLREAGLPVVSDPLESARGPLIRVRVGPFESAAQAQAAAERIRQLGLDARVYGPR